MKRPMLLGLALAAVLLTLYVVVDRRQQQLGAGVADQLLPGFESRRLTGVRVFDAEHRVVALQWRGDEEGWWLSHPVVARADRAAVDQLMANLELGQVLRVLPSGANVGELGLDIPRLRVVLERRGAADLEIDLGQQDATGQGVYARVLGRVVVVSARLAQALDVDRETLQDHSVLPLSADTVSSLRVEGAGQRWVIERDAQGRWLVGGDSERRLADVRKVAGLIATLTTARFRRFVRLPTSNALPRLEAHGDGATVTLELGDRCPGAEGDQIVVSRAGGGATAGCVDRSVADVAAMRAEQLEQRRLLTLREPDLDRIEWQADGRPKVSLVRDGTSWRRGVGGIAVESDAITGWLDRLGAVQLEADRMENGGAAATASDASDHHRGTGIAAMLRLHTDRGREQVVKVVPCPRSRSLCVRREGESSLWGVASSDEQLVLEGPPVDP